jgi:hypothetical protein
MKLESFSRSPSALLCHHLPLSVPLPVKLLTNDNTQQTNPMPKPPNNSTAIAGSAPSPSSRRYKCDECHDTGYFGDMGPGRAGNNEYVPCDCRRDTRPDDEKWRDNFVLPIATEMKRRGIGEIRIKLTEKGTAVFELIPRT